jgi:hypothetical protein
MGFVPGNIRVFYFYAPGNSKSPINKKHLEEEESTNDSVDYYYYCCY